MLVDQGDVEAAKLSVELAREADQDVDPAIEAIANAGIIKITVSDTADIDEDVRVKSGARGTRKGARNPVARKKPGQPCQVGQGWF